ncbi:hypothetical protein EDB80DRAFT_677481 [Ilyonectria destructans]|nr:hypothetical protein EDB80DRAFT_677481 [Ilyonectria destructans]
MADSEEKPSVSPERYTIGWICALSEELAAARPMLDQEHRSLPEQGRNDDNSYVLGNIEGHNIAMPILPDCGISAATSALKSMKSTFPNLRFILMVGIGGGIPTKKKDIRLGDVVVSQPNEQGGGVIQYDFGREEKDGYRRVGIMNRPPKQILSTVNKLKTESSLGKELSKIIETAVERFEDPEEWAHPDTKKDVLFQTDFSHIRYNSDESDDDCEMCSASATDDNIVKRVPRKTTYPKIHYGNIASGNTVMKNALKRDLVRRKENVICFEMEAAGIMNEAPCMVIRGISDYADSHKNEIWKRYAALVAAAYVKKLLLEISPQAVAQVEPLKETLQAIQQETTKTSRTVTSIHHAQQNDNDAKILEWLTPVDYASRHSDLFRQWQPGTGQWFLESEEFQAWRAGGNQTLFCPGIPGAGKTMIAAIAIEHLRRQFGSDPRVALAYIYCSFNQEDIQKTENLLSSLLRQLARQSPMLPESVRSLYERHKRHNTRAALDEVSHALSSVAAQYSRVYVVMDALDECQTSDYERTKLLKELFALQNQDSTNSKALDTDSIPTVANSVSLCAGLVIYDTKSDIIRLVHHTTQEYFLATSQRWFPEADSELAMACVTYLSFETFNSGPCKTRNTFEQRHRRNPLYIYAAQNWGWHAKNIPTSPPETVASSELTTGPRAAQSLIMAFLEITSSVEASGQTLLIHEMIDPLWVKNVTGLHLAAFFGLASYAKFLLEKKGSPDPVDHVGRTPLSWAAERGFTNVVELLLSNKDVSLDSMDFTLGFTPLLWATKNGHEKVVELLLRKGPGNTLRLRGIGGQTPLTLAVENDNQAIVRKLLEHGAETNLNFEGCYYPLNRGRDYGPDHASPAVFLGQFYLENRNQAEVHLRVTKIHYHEAARRVSAHVKNLGLTHGSTNQSIPSNSDFQHIRTPLSRAAELGYLTIAKMLLDHGANIDMPDMSGRFPFSIAVDARKWSVAKMLLERGTTCLVGEKETSPLGLLHRL